MTMLLLVMFIFGQVCYFSLKSHRYCVFEWGGCLHFLKDACTFCQSDSVLGKEIGVIDASTESDQQHSHWCPQLIIPSFDHHHDSGCVTSCCPSIQETFINLQNTNRRRCLATQMCTFWTQINAAVKTVQVLVISWVWNLVVPTTLPNFPSCIQWKVEVSYMQL